jgi:hypothetical protein
MISADDLQNRVALPTVYVVVIKPLFFGGRKRLKNERLWLTENDALSFGNRVRILRTVRDHKVRELIELGGRVAPR